MKTPLSWRALCSPQASLIHGAAAISTALRISSRSTGIPLGHRSLEERSIAQNRGNPWPRRTRFGLADAQRRQRDPALPDGLRHRGGAGMVLATSRGWGNAAWIALSVALAFLFGYGLTIRPVARAGSASAARWRRRLRLTRRRSRRWRSSTTRSSCSFPGRWRRASVTHASGGASAELVVAFVGRVPVNRWLIARGRGHAVIHESTDTTDTRASYSAYRSGCSAKAPAQVSEQK